MNQSNLNNINNHSNFNNINNNNNNFNTPTNLINEPNVNLKYDISVKQEYKLKDNDIDMHSETLSDD